MKSKKRILALILVLTLSFSLCLPAFAEMAPSPEKELNYVTIGASNTNGYCLHGYLDDALYANPNLKPNEGPGISGLNICPEGCYPDLIVKHFEELGYTVNHAQLAQSTMRVEELRVLLDENYYGDVFTKWRFYDGDNPRWWTGILDDLRDLYAESITNADLITYDLGANNFGTFLTKKLFDDRFKDIDLSIVVGDEYASLFTLIRERAKNTLMEATGGAVAPGDFETIDDLIDTLSYILLGYCVNFDITMGKILELNDGRADIVVLAIQNVVSDINVSLGGIIIPLGDIIGDFTNLANTYMSLLSPHRDKYLFADVRENGRITFFSDQAAAWDGDPDKIDINIKDCFDVYDTTVPLFARFRVSARLLNQMDGKSYPETQLGLASNNFDLAALNEKAKNFGASKAAELGYDPYELGCRNAYAALLTVCQAAVKVDPLPLDALIANGFDTYEIELAQYDKLINLIKTAADYGIEGKEYPQDEMAAYANEMLSDEDSLAAISFFVLTTIGNTFFSHPNYQGHQEVYNAIMSALKNKTSADDAFYAALEGVRNDILENSLQLGTSFVYVLLEKVASVFGLSDGTVEFLSAVLPDSRYAAEILMWVIGVSDPGQVKLIGDCVDEAASELKPYAGVHTLERVNARRATFFYAGNIEYYVCTDCGKCFADAAGTQEISRADTVIRQLGVQDLVEYIFGLFARLLENFSFTGSKPFC